jgi:hypothetical protein
MSIKSNVLVVGGLGHFGVKITSHLQADTNNHVLILEKKEKIRAAYISGEIGEIGIPLSNIVAFEEGIFSQFDGEIFSTVRTPMISSVVFAIRHRAPATTGLQTAFVLEDGLLRDSLEKVVLFPLELLRCLEYDRPGKTNRRVILVYSSNANYVSHQTLAYHVTNSAVANLFKFLAVNLYGLGVKVFMIEVGVLDANVDQQGKIGDLQKFAPSKFKELVELLDFLLRVDGFGLVGKSIQLTGVRNLLDSTAVSEGVFGDLRVRSNIQPDSNF